MAQDVITFTDFNVNFFRQSTDRKPQGFASALRPSKIGLTKYFPVEAPGIQLKEKTTLQLKMRGKAVMLVLGLDLKESLRTNFLSLTLAYRKLQHGHYILTLTYYFIKSIIVKDMLAHAFKNYAMIVQLFWP